MNDDYIKKELSTLIDNLGNLEIRTKQACVDLSIESIEKLKTKERINLDYILKIVNKEAGLDMSISYFRNMINRSLKKQGMETKKIRPDNKERTKKSNFDFNPTPNKNRIYGDDE